MTRSIPKQQLTDTAETVLERRYYLKDAEGKPLENWETLCRRVANAVALVDCDLPDYGELPDRFFKMIYYLDFLPNSPTLMNAGTDLGQLAACFVLPVGDSIKSLDTWARLFRWSKTRVRRFFLNLQKLQLIKYSIDHSLAHIHVVDFLP